MQALLRVAAAASFALVLSSTAQTQAAELNVLAGAGIAPILKELVPKFEASSGHKLVIAYSAGPSQIKQITSGEPFDVAITTHEVISAPGVKAHLGPTKDIARVGIGAAVRAGAPKPDIGSAEGLKQALLKAKSITFVVESASGAHILKVLERLGIGDAMKAKTTPQKTPADVAQAVAKGEAELGLSITNALIAPGVEPIGSLPSDLNLYLTFTAAVGAKSGQAGAADALIKYLTTPAAAATIKARGMEPL